MAQVFISYAREDRVTAQTFAWLFQQSGYTVWWDRNMYPGQDLNDRIMKEIVLARAVVVLWSPYSADSKWVRGEARTAVEFAKFVPIEISPCNIPIEFTGYHTVRMCGEHGQHEFEQLMESIAFTMQFFSREDCEDDTWNP